MILDTSLLLSDAQAITATAASTNIIDLGATGTVYGAGSALIKDIGKGCDIPLLIQVVEAFNNLTSLAVTVQTDDNAGFSSARDVLSATLPLASLTLGRTFPIIEIPPGVAERYLRLNYTVTGTAPTLGKVTAGVIASYPQSNGVTF